MVRTADVARWWVPARQADELDANLVAGPEAYPEGVRASGGAEIGPRQDFGYVGPGDLVLLGMRAVPEVDAVARGVDSYGLAPGVYWLDVHQ
jgi:hypothetical protein